MKNKGTIILGNVIFSIFAILFICIIVYTTSTGQTSALSKIFIFLSIDLFLMTILNLIANRYSLFWKIIGLFTVVSAILSFFTAQNKIPDETITPESSIINDFESSSVEESDSKSEPSNADVSSEELTTAANDELELFVGELLEFSEDGNGMVIIKAKITSSYNNTATIQQNFHNIERFILNDGGDKYNEIQYLAVADMSNGEESKVISFTVTKDIIDKVSKKDIVAIEMEDYVTDLWILPSLIEQN